MKSNSLKAMMHLARTTKGRLAGIVASAIEQGIVVPSILEKNLVAAGYKIFDWAVPLGEGTGVYVLVVNIGDELSNTHLPKDEHKKLMDLFRAANKKYEAADDVYGAVEDDGSVNNVVARARSGLSDNFYEGGGNEVPAAEFRYKDDRGDALLQAMFAALKEEAPAEWMLVQVRDKLKPPKVGLVAPAPKKP
jgi:hypothetical protein